MNTALSAFVPIATGAVAVVLLLGLVNMLRGGNPNRSQMLMRWRIGLQLLALIGIMAALWLKTRG
jgi:hypothetical protein